jgi:tol-pal system protein YbgF
VVERQAQALLELQRQLDAQSGELRSLRGELEQLQELARKGGEEQRNLYADIDRRLVALETRPAAASASVGSGGAASGEGAAAANAATAGSDEDAYQAALAKLRAKDYAGATAALSAFAKRYPESTLRDNAAYWLGEAHYVDGHYAEALEGFQAVVTQFPESRKRADALLKAGYCQVELRQWAGARKSLRRVVSEFPGTPAAKEASARLATFDGSKAR